MLNPDAPLESIMTQPLFVPETKRIDDLLTELKTKKENFVICVDEYGGTAGIATLEDILEEIFGEYYDEYEKVENPIHPRGRNEYMVDAKISLLDFNEYFATHLEAEEASTLGGFILEKLGEVPKRGRVLATEECEIHVQEVLRGRQIRTVLVRIKK
jgi:CBS domain containing-hemolysin-like protein